LFISNVPGAQVPLYMAGAKLTHQYAMAPLANNMGLFIATPSYNGQISFCIICERSIMPDIAFFRTCLEASFAALRDAPPTPPKVHRDAAERPKSPARTPAKRVAPAPAKPAAKAPAAAKKLAKTPTKRKSR
jgi:hypothetical protein